MSEIKVSAPGKLMLFGEHAVLYNKPCIVTAVDKRLRVVVRNLDNKTFLLDALEVNISKYQKPIKELGTGDIPFGARFIENAVRIFFHTYKISFGVHIRTQSEFSSQYGFGSSSASTVCTIKALSEIYKIDLSIRDIFNICYRSILDVQGNTSGFDIAAAIYGGTLYYVKGAEVVEVLKIKPIPLIVGYSGVKADTLEMIKKIERMKKQFPRKTDKIFSSIEVLVNKANKAIVAYDWKQVGELFDKNQRYLNILGASTKKLDRLILAAKNAGAWGAKLSGAGGGDCMIAIASPHKREAVQGAIRKAGGEVIDINSNAPGVKVDNK